MGFFDKLKDGLSKTKDAFNDKVNAVMSNFRKVDEEMMEALEEALILSDVGTVTSTKIINNLRSRVKLEKLEETEVIQNALKEEIVKELTAKESTINLDTTPSVMMMVGVNGAGKTTLFTALQICLYGYHSFGFKSASKQYFKEVYNLVNNKVRLDEWAAAYVEVVFEHVTDTDVVLFSVKRLWTWLNGEIEEQLIVTQNGIRLDEDGLVNFQKFLIHLIP